MLLVEHQLYRFGKLEHMPELPMILPLLWGIDCQGFRTNSQSSWVLGDLPLLGNLFRSKSETGLKREVIIALLPLSFRRNSVHAECLKMKILDKFGHRLFRDAYRIRAKDTLTYAILQPGFKKLQKAADRVVQDHKHYGRIYPYEKFARGAVPGEDALVRRQIYEVLKRQKAAEVLDSEKLIFFEPDEQLGSGFKVRFLSDFLSENAPFVMTEEGDNKAVGLCFRLTRSSHQADELLREPTPEIKIVDCPDEDT